MRASDERLDQVRAWIERERREGYPPELAEMFQSVVAVFDNAERLVGLFGHVDEGSAAEAWRLYQTYQLSRRPRTLH